MKGRPWYKRYSGDFLGGVIGLGAVTIGVYAVILDLIYDRRGSAPNDPKWIAGFIGEPDARVVAAAIRKLVAHKKLFVVKGELRNPRADAELNEAKAVSDRLSTAGQRGGRASKNKALPKARLKHTEAEAEAEAEADTEKDTLSEPARELVEKAAVEWNNMAGAAGLALVGQLSPARRGKLIARIRELGGLDAWRAVLAQVSSSSFLCGAGERGWKADFDWLLKPANLTKVREGGFVDRTPKALNGATAPPAMVWITSDDPRWGELVAAAGGKVKAYQSNKQIGVGYFFEADLVAGKKPAA